MLTEGKVKYTNIYKGKILKIGYPFLIHHIHKIFNVVVKYGFPKSYTQNLIVLVFKSEGKYHFNYRAIMIITFLSNLY